MRRATLVITALLAASLVSAGELYKWVDKDGNVHYSDTPVEGAEKVDLPEPMVFDAPEAERPKARQDSTEADTEEEPFYTAFRFISPKSDQVFWNTAGRIPVQLDVEPRMRSGDELRVFFNGERIGMSGFGTTLTEVYRGTYNIRAAVVAPDGTEVVSTGPVTFHVKQTSIANPP